VTTVEDLIKQNDFCTATTLLDARFLRPIPDWIQQMPFGDFPIFLTVLYRSQAKAYCLEDVTSVYRMHSGGVYRSMYSSDEKIIITAEWAIDAYRKLQQWVFNGEYDLLIEDCIRGKEQMIVDLKDQRKKRSVILKEIIDYVPNGGAFILVDDFNLETIGQFDGRCVMPFTEQNGVFWGPPADDHEAIAEIERQRATGVLLIVFTWHSFWWLQHYAGMYTYLQENYECIMNDDRLIGFLLQKEEVAEHISFR
jgi:hypothetical protein